MKEIGIVEKRMEIRDVRNPHYCVWLQEMAEQGLFYQGHSLTTAKFRQGLPEKRRYRSIEKSYHSISDEELELYESSGWEVINDWGGITFFTTASDDAPEIFSDKDSYLRTHRKNAKLSVVGIIALALVAAILIYQELSVYIDKERLAEFGRLHLVTTGMQNIIVNICFTGMMVIFFTVYLIMAIGEIRMIRLYSGTDSIDYDIPYDDKSYIKNKRRAKLPNILLICTLAILAIVWINVFIEDALWGTKALKYNEPHPVMFRELNQEAWEERLPLIQETGDDPAAREARYMADVELPGFLFKKGYTENLFVDVYETSDNEYPKTELGYLSEYMIARNEKIAEEYLGEEIAYDKYDKVEEANLLKEMEAIGISCEGVDYAGYLETEDSQNTKGLKTQHLYLRKGADIQIITYAGEMNIRDKLELFVKEFEE